MLHYRTRLILKAAVECRFNLLKRHKTSVAGSAYRDRHQRNSSNVELKENATNDGGLPEAAKDSGKLQARQPLAKNFFVGVVDKELLAFPEVITRENMHALQNEMLPLKNYFTEELDIASIDATRHIAPAVTEQLKQLDLYGINAAKNYAGKGWGWSESLMAAEHETVSTDVALALYSHRVIIDLLQELGSEQQKQQFMSKLASGDMIGAEAIYEMQAPEDDFFNTKAEQCPDRHDWVLQGEKAFVIAGPLPAGATPLLLVIAQTSRPNLKSENARGTTCFLVDTTLPGVKLGEQHLTIGCRGTQLQRIKFDQARVPESCIIGDLHDGNAVAEVLLRAGRLRYAMLGLGLSKSMLQNLSQFCVNTRQCGVKLKDVELTQTHLARATCAIYAMESMIYLTAGVLDEFYKPDVALESAITKYFTLKECHKLATQCLDVLGAKSLHAGETTEIAFRNALQLYTHNESIDGLRLFIALTGLQHAGGIMNDQIHKSRNPLFHPAHILSQFLQTSSIDNPKTKMRLGEHLHPSLEPAAQCIEQSVARLQMSVELLFTRYGNSIVERHNELMRLAEMSSTIYAMFASAARASRSYCIGLQNADCELLTATTICSEGRDLVKIHTTDIFNGQYMNNDINMQRLAKQVVKNKGYFAQHALTYNF